MLDGLGDQKVRGLQVELSFVNIYETTPGFTEVVQQIESLGNAPTAFYPISRATDRLRIVEADGVFVARN